jgi:hypothetical protein
VEVEGARDRYGEVIRAFVQCGRVSAQHCLSLTLLYGESLVIVTRRGCV